MQSVLSCFALLGAPVSSEPYGSGHINGTQLVTCDSGARYILQRINTSVFRAPEALMRNIELVTAHLRTKTDDPRGVLRLVPTYEGFNYAKEGGEYWRVYALVENSVCHQRADAVLFYESAVAFGRFQNHLADFPAEALAQTIPRFHDTPARYAALHRAVLHDAAGRRGEVEREIDFALARESFAHTLIDLQAAGELPLRVTHNDTKINNVLFDATTRKALCVIDLDTVMPGLSANDFGDAIRFGASTAAEDERDLSRVHFDLQLYDAYVRGYLSTCGESLTRAEKAMLPTGAKMMTLECGIRFLADHLAGDVYFHVSREGQNLDRARTQFRLVAEMEKNWGKMHKIVEWAVKN
jgi:Ser/Thr protein kinase RdoA (MazF antagonist)